MYRDLANLEAQFQLVLRDYAAAQCHDQKVQLAQVAREIATEYRQRMTDYKRMLKTKALPDEVRSDQSN